MKVDTGLALLAEALAIADKAAAATACTMIKEVWALNIVV